MKKFVFELLLLCLFPVVLESQTLLHQKINPDPSSLGGMTIVCGHTSYASFGNVAALAFEPQTFMVSAGDMLWLSENGNLQLFNTSASLKLSELWGISLGGAYMYKTPYQCIDMNGNYIGMFRTYDWIVRAGTSYKITEYLSSGVNFSYAYSVLAENESYNAIATDLLIMGTYSGFNATVGITDVGMSSHRGEYKYNLPSAAILAASYEKMVASKHMVTLSADINTFFEGSIAVSSTLKYSYDGFLVFNVGYQNGGHSLLPTCCAIGASVKYRNFSLSTAYQRYFDNEFIDGTVSVCASYVLDR